MKRARATGGEWIHKQMCDGALIVSGSGEFETLSSGLIGGGLGRKRYLLNLQVPHGYASDDPILDMEQRVHDLGLPVEGTTAMMTAAEVGEVVEGDRSGEQFQLRVYVTAGVGNAARAGRKRRTYPGYVAGTINIIAAIDGRLTHAALVNCLITITEAKAAALQDLGVLDAEGQVATGTTTDTVIVAATQHPVYSGVHQYAGVATELGNALADAVYQSLSASLAHLKKRTESDEC